MATAHRWHGSTILIIFAEVGNDGKTRGGVGTRTAGGPARPAGHHGAMAPAAIDRPVAY
jgi:hypothetical protein